jgi:hypothetical protein
MVGAAAYVATVRGELRILESARERMQLQILKFSRILAEQTAKGTAEAAMQQMVNVEFNNQAKIIYKFLWKSIKRFQFCRN